MKSACLPAAQDGTRSVSNPSNAKSGGQAGPRATTVWFAPVDGKRSLRSASEKGNGNGGRVVGGRDETRRSGGEWPTAAAKTDAKERLRQLGWVEMGGDRGSSSKPKWGTASDPTMGDRKKVKVGGLKRA